MHQRKVLIVGAGLLGLAVAYQLQRRSTNKYRVDIFEKESGPAHHQSGRNSGVLHCGLYYQPGSLKARLAVQGIREMTQFCERYAIAHEICGKVVVASTPKEVSTLNQLAERGRQNGLQGLVFLTKEELKRREPAVIAHEALLVPEEGIVDFKGVATQLAQIIQEAGGNIYYNRPITCIRECVGKRYEVAGYDGAYDLVINCAGLFSDRVFTLGTGKPSPVRIVPFRGEYLLLKPHFSHLINHLVYPVPDTQYPFLGVHFTRLVSGRREVGPNAVLALKREGYKPWDISMRDTMDALLYRGLQRFLAKNLLFATREFASSLFLSSFVAKARKLVPDISPDMFERGHAGVRAQALSPSGDLLMDFHVERFGNQVHILNAPSPGATACLSIASYVVDSFCNLA